MSVLMARKTELDRDTAMSARPSQAPVIGTTQRPDGGMNVTVLVRRPTWLKLFGASEQCERTFGLDAFGREVFEACDGKRSVRGIVRRFAKVHPLGRAEAEMSVSAFLKTLVTKGLVRMEVRKEQRKR